MEAKETKATKTMNERTTFLNAIELWLMQGDTLTTLHVTGKRMHGENIDVNTRNKDGFNVTYTLNPSAFIGFNRDCNGKLTIVSTSKKEIRKYIADQIATTQKQMQEYADKLEYCKGLLNLFEK